MQPQDPRLARRAAHVLEQRLPPGWTLALLSSAGRGVRARVTASDGRSRELAVWTLARADPRAARRLPEVRPLLVVADYLSRGAQEAIADAGASYIDHTGNVRVVLDQPGLFISTTGAAVHPQPRSRSLTLRGVKAARMVCALAQAPTPVGVRELAAVAGTDPGYVSRLLAMLDRDAIVDRSARGHVERVDWRKLLTKWAEEGPLESRSRPSTWLAPRGLGSLWDALRHASFPYLVTGSAAAAWAAPVAPTRLGAVYVDDPDQAAATLDLRPTRAGANVLLLQPDDPQIYLQVAERDGLRTAKLPLVAADLLSGPGRAPAEAEALLDWMGDHEEVWRG